MCSSDLSGIVFGGASGCITVFRNPAGVSDFKADAECEVFHVHLHLLSVVSQNRRKSFVFPLAITQRQKILSAISANVGFGDSFESSAAHRVRGGVVAGPLGATANREITKKGVMRFYLYLHPGHHGR